MRIFRAKFLKSDHLAIVPERGYERSDRQSAIAIKYLEWRAHRDGVCIQHAYNGGEKRVMVDSKLYKLDGWVEGEGRAIEFLG